MSTRTTQPPSDGAGRGAPGRARVPRELREPEMIDVATRIFGRRGFHDASMDEIAAGARVSKPMLYSYFESKEGLFQACARRLVEQLGERVRAAATSRGLPPDHRLWNGLLAVFGFIEDNKEMWMMFQPREAEAVSARSAAEGRDAISELLSEVLVEAALGEGVAPEAAAHAAPMGYALTAAVLGMARWWLAHPEEPRELQALRIMNLTWMGFGGMLDKQLWLPPAPAGSH